MYVIQMSVSGPCAWHRERGLSVSCPEVFNGDAIPTVGW